MPAFAPRPTFNAWNRQQQIGIALDTPFTFTQAVGENFQQGVLDSFGLGSVARDFASGGRDVPNALGGVPLFGQILTGAYNARDAFAPDTSRLLTKEQYAASPSFRTDIPWDPSMTENRAAALSGMYDKKKVREFFSQKQPIAAFLGQLGGQALDPINYVPVFGEGVQAAAVARMGGVAGRALLSASEAAINTAAFGVLTAGVRSKFGDDVSWESITTDVAMSAVIGGIFGAGIGVLARGADRRAMALQKVQPKLETLGNVMQARAVLNDAVAGLVDNGEVRLNPNSVGVVERMADQVVERTAGTKALRDETAQVRGSNAGEVVISPSGSRVQVRPEVVEASTLIRATGALQVRDRTSAASAAQVEDIAINLDPARLMPNVDASQGAPLVGGDNMVDSGNGRVMAIKRAYEAYPGKAAEYRAALDAAGYDTTGMQQPVLVNRRVTDLSETARAQFNAEVNGPTTARLSAVELASMDREALTAPVMDALDNAPVTASSNRAFVQRFLANLPQNERGSLLDRGGELNADGVRRVENALIAAAYGDVDAGVLRRFAEATDDNTRSIVGALSDVAGTWARMRGSIKRQEVSAEFDLTPELTQALRLLGRWREDAAAEGRPVSTVIREGLAQADLLTGEVSPEAQTFVRMFYTDDRFARAVGRDVLAERLRNIANSTIELGRPSLFGDTLMPTKGEVLTNAQRNEADLFAADGLEPRTQEGVGPAGAEAGGEYRSGVEGSPAGESITATMTARFEAAGRPADEAAAAAQVVDAFYTTMASRLGLMPDELTRRFGLPDVVRGEERDGGNELFQPAYHGTPHIFDRFEWSDATRGKGEGAQAFGDGLYFAGNKEVAEYYRRQLAGEHIKLDGKPVDDNWFADADADALRAMEVVIGQGGDVAKAQARLNEWANGTNAAQAKRNAGSAKWLEENASKISVDKQGRLYKVDIPDDSELLAWDKPLAEQSSAVREKMAALGFEERTASEWKPREGSAEDRPIIIDQYGSEIVQNEDGTYSAFGKGPDGRSARVDYRVTLERAKQAIDRFNREDSAPTGEQMYRELSKRLRATAEEPTLGWASVGTASAGNNFGGDRAASAALREIGIPGHRFLDQGSRAKGEGSHNYVIYDDSRVNITDFEQRGARGAIDLGANVIRMFEQADASTALHETGHLFLGMYKRIADDATAPSALRAEWETIKRWWSANASDVARDANASGRAEGVTDADVREVLADGTSGDKAKDMAIDVGLHEQWARTFEAYVREGEAPSEGLRGVFEQFKRWLTGIYKQAQDLGANLSPDIRAVFDRMLTMEPVARDEPGLPLGEPTKPLAALDATEPRADEPPAGMHEAEARVGKGEDMKHLAEVHGVKEDGTFIEQLEVDQMREEGRLTEEDEAELEAADQLYADADAYAKSLEVAGRCMI